MFTIAELKKRPEGLSFTQTLDLQDQLQARNSQVLALSPVQAQGEVSYDDGLYLLNYDLSYQISLPSSRSLEPVQLQQTSFVSEVFIEEQDLASKQDLVDADLVMLLQGGVISLEESVLDNILLNIPLRVLTAAEEADQDLPTGQDWALLSEDQYLELKKSEKEANNPFVGLDGLFED